MTVKIRETVQCGLAQGALTHRGQIDLAASASASASALIRKQVRPASPNLDSEPKNGVRRWLNNVLVMVHYYSAVDEPRIGPTRMRPGKASWSPATSRLDDLINSHESLSNLGLLINGEIIMARPWPGCSGLAAVGRPTEMRFLGGPTRYLALRIVGLLPG
ncbi:hypothetical protein BO78DRAFT_158656 [Aspergillus sclerotiicarbonarius CBS 121057]|uniref:Uncharacterized protein n=1 Tax=Aspergillus sclerotiicarbonarius (strain CBS 121057 / IBT 28362) TaxID=1448318 RepID=A0A319E6D0_ASPSB|nr:hypothetical protein BO78DRAFT_158656 [Aspergillus sclerotiicarbonarius CBS 121057]